ncbi:MAG: hypothetical protein ACXW4O_13735, partial [Candidatus Binatia bacterium]
LHNVSIRHTLCRTIVRSCRFYLSLNLAIHGIAIAEPAPAACAKTCRQINGGKLTMLKKLWGAMLIVALFALAGCPEVSQQGSGGSSEKTSGGD